MKIVLESISRFSASIIAFIATYIFFVSALWAFVSPVTHFAQEYLRLKLSGIAWFLVFYVLPSVPATMSTLILLAKSDYRPYLKEFQKHTSRNLERIRMSIPGSGTTFQKQEILTCEDQLALGNAVLLSGDGGTGKSGIGAILIGTALADKKPALLIDSRQLDHIKSAIGLSQYYRSGDDLAAEIQNLGREFGFRLVIDQLDNVAGKPSATVIVEFAIALGDKTGVEVIVISRQRESFEMRLLQPLTGSGFVLIECQALTEREVREEFYKLGIVDPPTELMALCRNLLNLEIVSKLKEENPTFVFEQIDGEVMLWDSYFNALRDREAEGPEPGIGEELMNEAMNLAREVLCQGHQEIILENPLSETHRRLVSCRIIDHLEGIRYRFGHERFQDYLYARYAADRGYMPEKIVEEMGRTRSRNSTVWVQEMYRQRASIDQDRFLEEILNGG